MKITQEAVVDHQTILNIELEDGDLDTYLDQGYRRVVQRAVVPGFRKGKAPRRIIENYLGREALLEPVLDTMLQEVTSQAIAKQSLSTVGHPNIELLELIPFKLKATVPLTPGVDLGPYHDIRIPVEPWQATEDQLKERLEELRKAMGTWEPAERPAKIGDLVTMALKGEVEGRSVLDQKDLVFVLDEKDDRPFPGFSQQLVDMEADKPKEFAMDVPQDYADKDIAGKKIQFNATISDIKERKLPDLDDEFAKSVGDGYESLDALRKKLEEDLKAHAEADARTKYQNSAIKALMEKATVELPPVMIDHEIDRMEESQERVFSRVGIRIGDYLQRMGKTPEEMRDDMREEAILGLKRTFAFTRLAEQEGLKVSEEEVLERIEETFREHDEDEPGHDHTVTDELKASVRQTMLSQKTLDRLVAIARGEAPALALPEKPADEPKQETKEPSPATSPAEGGAI